MLLNNKALCHLMKSSGKGGFAKITLTLPTEFRQRKDGRKEGKKDGGEGRRREGGKIGRVS